VANMDTSAAQAFAYCCLADSYAARSAHVALEGPNSPLVVLNGADLSPPSPHTIIVVKLVTLGLAISDHLFVTRYVWQALPDGSFLLAVAPLEDALEDAHVSAIVRNDRRLSRAVRAQERGFWSMRPRAPNVCEVTSVFQGDWWSQIPLAVQLSRVRMFTKSFMKLQDKFKRTGKLVDAEVRAAFPGPPTLETLEDEQKAIVAACR